MGLGLFGILPGKPMLLDDFGKAAFSGYGACYADTFWISDYAIRTKSSW